MAFRLNVFLGDQRVGQILDMHQTNRGGTWQRTKQYLLK